MSKDRTPAPDRAVAVRRGASYFPILARLAALSAALAAVALCEPKSDTRDANSTVEKSTKTSTHAPLVTEFAEPAPMDESIAWRHRIISHEQDALRRARAQREAAQDDRDAAQAALADAQSVAARLAAETRAIEERVRAIRPRVDAARTRVASLRSQHAQLSSAIASLAATPRPRPKPLRDQSPFSRPPRGSEYHFEIRADRVAFINMDELLDRLKVDARLQIRTLTIPRPVAGEAGPVGEFAIRYRLVPVGLGVSGSPSRPTLDAEYSLAGWEIVPVRDRRGESLKQALEPASDFGRAVNRLDPERETITLWVYPDGFDLYRRLRDLLHERGFMVAARPLPADMPIRGSPTGSLSAAQ